MSLPQSSVWTSHRLEVEQLHDEVYEELQSCRGEIALDPAWRKRFMDRFHELIQRLTQFAHEVTTEDDFNWLTSVATKWEEAFFTTFDEPLDLRTQIGISHPLRKLEPRFRPLSDEEVRRYLSNKANEMGRARKLTWLFQRWAELRSHPDRIHSEIHSTSTEMKEDWYWASVCFAAEVLEGKIGFPYRIGPDRFALLEGVWLEDVKRLKAYLLWEKDGSHWHPDGGRKYFFQATDLLRQAALSSNLKASENSFARVELYLEGSYLSDGLMDPKRERSAHELIGKKAHRIWRICEERGRARHASANWSEAERYVRGFYQHIVPAVKRGDPKHIAPVAEAVCSAHRGQWPCDIVNCFEASLLIYYLDPVKLRSASEPRTHLLF